MRDRPVVVLGVDGCRGGWAWARIGYPDSATGPVRSRLHTETDISFGCARDLGALVAAMRADVVAVDMPIGLPQSGSRQADLAARRLLRPHGSRVFPAPVRDVLLATDYRDALHRSREASGTGLSLQAWNIVPKIVEVDRLVRDGVNLVEVHPEVSFTAMAGAPIAAPKRKATGRNERIAVCRSRFSTLGDVPRGDDHLDALACAWSARRIVDAAAVTLGGEYDECGVPMRIVY